jgi:deoxyribonuclease V
MMTSTNSEPTRLYAAVDVHYPETGGARAALVAASDARFGDIISERTSWLEHPEPYQPGAFYRRELPAYRQLLAGQTLPALLVVDGYVDLDPSGRAGLGAHVYAEFGVPVVGVAKTAFHSATHAIPVRRGGTIRPLYVTAAGLSRPEAAALVRAMAGEFRLPDALRRVDALARGR